MVRPGLLGASRRGWSSASLRRQGQSRRAELGVKGRGGVWNAGGGRDSDLDDSDAHTHAQDDANVLLKPRLHLLHAALEGEHTVTSPLAP